MDWIEIIVAIVSGILIVMPVLTKLIMYVQIAVKEKNWNLIAQLTLKYMTTAESMFSTGAERKDWVIAMVKTSAQGVEYDLDEAAITKISDLIDTICSASKIINTKITKSEPALNNNNVMLAKTTQVMPSIEH